MFKFKNDLPFADMEMVKNSSKIGRLQQLILANWRFQIWKALQKKMNFFPLKECSG